MTRELNVIFPTNTFLQTTCCTQAIETADGKKTCGGCTVHAQTCSGGIGIFLDIKKCRIILSSDAIRGNTLSEDANQVS